MDGWVVGVECWVLMVSDGLLGIETFVIQAADDCEWMLPASSSRTRNCRACEVLPVPGGPIMTKSS